MTIGEIVQLQSVHRDGTILVYAPENRMIRSSVVRRFDHDSTNGHIAVLADERIVNLGRTPVTDFGQVGPVRRPFTEELVKQCAEAIREVDRTTFRPITAEEQARAVLNHLATLPDGHRDALKQYRPA